MLRTAGCRRLAYLLTMATFIAIPILAVLVIFQSAVFSQVSLLHGTVDLVLLAVIAWSLQKRVQTAWQWGIIGGLFIGIVSALPFWASLGIFLVAVAVSLALRRRVWQAPILAMFIATFTMTVLAHVLTVIALRLSGTTLPLTQTINLISLPTLILNLVFAIPIFYILADIAKWLYPAKLEA